MVDGERGKQHEQENGESHRPIADPVSEPLTGGPETPLVQGPSVPQQLVSQPATHHSEPDANGSPHVSDPAPTQHERKMARLTLLGIGVAVITAAIFLIQLRVMTRQTEILSDEAAVSAASSSFAAAQTQKQVAAAQKQAKAAQTSATAAAGTAETARKEMELSERPWVSAEDVSIAKPLDFTYDPKIMVPNSGRMTIKYVLRNTGKSPAMHVMWRSKLIILSMTRDEGKEISDRESELCSPMRKMQSQLLDLTIFPGDKISDGEGLGLYPKEIASGLRSRESGIFKHKGYISLAVIACIDYRSPFSPQHHQTRYAFLLGIPEPSGGFMSDLRPEGIYPDVKLIYFSQSAN